MCLGWGVTHLGISTGRREGAVEKWEDGKLRRRRSMMKESSVRNEEITKGVVVLA